MKRWYSLKTLNNKEKDVKKRIELEFNSSILSECVLPIEKRIVSKEGKKHIREKLTLPGYIFICLEYIDDDVIKRFKKINGVISFVGGRDGRPSVVTDNEMDQILSRVGHINENIGKETLFSKGQKVKITDGAFKDFDGVIEDIKLKRITVAVKVFGRSTLVDIDDNQIE